MAGVACELCSGSSCRPILQVTVDGKRSTWPSTTEPLHRNPPLQTPGTGGGAPTPLGSTSATVTLTAVASPLIAVIRWVGWVLCTCVG